MDDTRETNASELRIPRVCHGRSSIPRTSHAYMMRASYARHSSSKCDVKCAGSAQHTRCTRPEKSASQHGLLLFSAASKIFLLRSTRYQNVCSNVIKFHNSNLQQWLIQLHLYLCHASKRRVSPGHPRNPHSRT
jgi:hypothetical protein